MIFDISPEINPEIAVWPGDVPFSQQWQCKISEGSNIDLSSMNTTVHLGAHGDAPSHFHRDGQSIDQVDLNPYLGECYVVDARLWEKPLLEASLLDGDSKWKGVPRILFRTDSCPDPKVFNRDFKSFAPETIQYLADHGVQLIGIDTPSFDPFDSKDLPSHKKLFHNNIRNLEGLVLTGVEAGIYELIALPLKLGGFDASPVRAVLRSR